MMAVSYRNITTDYVSALYDTVQLYGGRENSSKLSNYKIIREMFQCVCRRDRADNYRAEEQRKVKVETGKFCWSVTKTLCCQFLNGC